MKTFRTLFTNGMINLGLIACVVGALVVGAGEAVAVDIKGVSLCRGSCHDAWLFVLTFGCSLLLLSDDQTGDFCHARILPAAISVVPTPLFVVIEPKNEGSAQFLSSLSSYLRSIFVSIEESRIFPRVASPVWRYSVIYPPLLQIQVKSYAENFGGQ